MDNKIVLSNFHPLVYEPAHKQTNLLKITAWLLAAGECAKNKITDNQVADMIYTESALDVDKFGVSPDYINQRQAIAFTPFMEKNKSSVILPDIKCAPNGLSLKERMLTYRDIALEIFEKFYRTTASVPSEIIHTTCSGYLSPSPAQMLIGSKKWFNTKVTHCYHMGCYGAVPAVRLALGSMAGSQLLNRPYNKVDVVHTEFLSLHFDATRRDIEHIINMTLFSDGFIKYSAYFDNDPIISEKGGLKILACYDEIIPDTFAEMSWIPTAYQFEMKLSKYVPGLIRSQILEFVRKLALLAGFNFDELKSEIILALHPGGPKIIDYVQEDLGLSDSQLKYSRQVLYNHGNMSSATLPHIWSHIIEDSSIKPHTKIISIAFGPGLTAAGLVLEKV